MAITLIEKGLKDISTNFTDLMTNVVQKRKITGNYYEYITIEDFNDQLNSMNVILSDLKLSCLCSKYCIPNELRLTDNNCFFFLLNSIWVITPLCACHVSQPDSSLALLLYLNREQGL